MKWGTLATKEGGSPGPMFVLLLDQEQNQMPFHGTPFYFLKRVTVVIHTQDFGRHLSKENKVSL